MFTERLFVYAFETRPREKKRDDKELRKLVKLCRAHGRSDLVHRADGCLPWSRLSKLVKVENVERAIDEQTERRLGYKREEVFFFIWRVFFVSI